MKSGLRSRSRACLPRARGSQQGYLLLVILLMLALLMIALVAVAPRIAQQIRRDREEETVRRGTQYARAIRLYYHKFGHYPNSLDELVSTNRMRFLRKKYKDPLSPNGEWRIIHYGEAKVVPTGFGFQNATAAGSAQPGAGTGGAFGTSTGSAGPGGGTGAGQPGMAPATSGGFGQSGTPSGGDAGSSGSSSAGSGSSGSSGSSSSSTGSAPTFGGGAIVGVAPLNNGTSIKELNGKNHYNDWEFVYDPRFDVSNRQVVPGGVIPSGAPGTTPQTGPGTQPTPPPGPSVSPMNPH